MHNGHPSVKTKVLGPERLVRAAAFLSLSTLFTFLLTSNRIDLLIMHRHSWVISAVVVSLAVLGLNELRGCIADRLHAHNHRSHQRAHSQRLDQPGHSHCPHQPAHDPDFCCQKCSCDGNHLAQNKLKWLLINALIFMVPMFLSFSTTPTVFDASAAMHRGLKMSLAADYPIGSIVELTGFVARWEELPEDEMVVTRFVVSCCVADAVPIGVAVRWPGAASFATNSWVYVKGVVQQENRPMGGGDSGNDNSCSGKPALYIQAQIVTTVEALPQPYLYRDHHDHK